MAMSIDKLLKISRNRVVTEADAKKLKERLAAAEKRFEEKERVERITFQDFLNSQCTL